MTSSCPPYPSCPRFRRARWPATGSITTALSLSLFCSEDRGAYSGGPPRPGWHLVQRVHQQLAPACAAGTGGPHSCQFLRRRRGCSQRAAPRGGQKHPSAAEEPLPVLQRHRLPGVRLLPRHRLSSVQLHREGDVYVVPLYRQEACDRIRCPGGPLRLIALQVLYVV
eukprot:TRINITY_DN6747_c0_g1_i1.p1 TRINITY_DN6747_c0_g1~~TRINITY_DN6747_c0_g1_i1.p1  ORF type:complete len:167 (+),score=4.67 TRINITY_DN6747_c0_g1_i1:56-556(+)